MAAWDKLPNAALIDRVLASLRQHYELWDAAWTAVRDESWDAARDSARDSARVAAWESARDMIKGAAWVSAADAARNAAWNAARDASGHVAWGAARDAIAALVAYDESADILRLSPDAVRAMAGWGIPAAVLLAPYLHLIQQEE